MEPITVKYKVLDARAKVPAYATPGSAAADLCAVLDEPLTLAPMERALGPPALPSSCRVPTAWHWCMPAAAFPSSTACAWPMAWAWWTATTAAN